MFFRNWIATIACCPALGVHPEEEKLVVGVRNQLLFIDSGDGSTLDTIKIGPNQLVKGLLYRPDGGALAMVASQSESFGLYILEDGEIRTESWYPGQGYLLDAAWSRDGKNLALLVTGFDGMPSRQVALAIWSFENKGLQVHIAPPNHQIRNFSWSPTGDLIAYGLWKSNGTGAETVIVDLAGASEVARYDQMVEPQFSPDGSTLAVRNNRPDNQALHFLRIDPAIVAPTPEETPEAKEFEDLFIPLVRYIYP